MTSKNYHNCKIKFIDIYYNLKDIFDKKDKNKYIKKIFNNKFKPNISYDKTINEFNKQFLLFKCTKDFANGMLLMLENYFSMLCEIKFWHNKSITIDPYDYSCNYLIWYPSRKPFYSCRTIYTKNNKNSFKMEFEIYHENNKSFSILSDNNKLVSAGSNFNIFIDDFDFERNGKYKELYKLNLEQYKGYLFMYIFNLYVMNKYKELNIDKIDFKNDSQEFQNNVISNFPLCYSNNGFPIISSYGCQQYKHLYEVKLRIKLPPNQIAHELLLKKHIKLYKRKKIIKIIHIMKYFYNNNNITCKILSYIN